MNLLLLIIIVTGIPAWIYFITRLAFGKYTYVPNEKDWLFGGYQIYHPGHLKPIHFVKTIFWHIIIFGSVVGFFVFVAWASQVEIG
jgi:hypothetical protein